MKKMSGATVSPTGLFERNFSPGRWIKLLRADLIQYKNNLSIATLAVFGAVLVVLVAFAPLTGRWQPHKIFVPGILFLGGIIITSYSFTELKDPIQRSAYLLVPGSTLEKVAARLMLTLVGFPLSALTLYWTTSLVGAGLGSLIWGKSFAIYRPFTEDTWRLLTVYPIVHSIFFLGAVWFRKGAAFKTLLAVVLAQIGLAVVTFFIFRIVFFDFFQGMSFNLSKEVDTGWLTSAVLRIGRVFIYVLFGPWLWVISYLRLADTEDR